MMVVGQPERAELSVSICIVLPTGLDPSNNAKDHWCTIVPVGLSRSIEPLICYTGTRLHTRDEPVISKLTTFRLNCENIKVAFQDLAFDGKNLTDVISFLTEFCNMVDEARLSKQAAYAILPMFLEGDPLRLYKTSVVAAHGSTFAVSN